MTAITVLASGVDSLYLSMRGELFDGLTVCLGSMVDLNRPTGEPIPFSFYDAEPDLLLRLHGWRTWPFWISSPRFELYVGASAPFPVAYAQLHSGFIHQVGIWA